jgi:hypothetical protein
MIVLGIRDGEHGSYRLSGTVGLNALEFMVSSKGTNYRQLP